MKKTIIFGVTNFSRLVKVSYEQDTSQKVTAYCVNRDYLGSLTKLDNIPVHPFEDLNELYGENNFEILITVGYAKMNDNRRNVFDNCHIYGYTIASFIHSTVKHELTQIQEGNIILSDCVLHPYTTIGSGNILVDGTTLGHESKVGDFNFFAGCTTGGMVSIGNNCFLGMKSIICNNCNVGDYTLLGAGTVLSKNCDCCTVVMPAANRTKKMSVEMLGTLLI